jgi:GAF domain-containing protein
MGSREPGASAAQMAAVARRLQEERDQSATILAVCEMAADTLGGDHAAITTVRHGQFTTIAATSDVPRRVDEIQYSTGEGPCLDALRERQVFRTGDLAHEPRWRHFGVEAAEQEGIVSMLSNVLYLEANDLGALNVYSSRRDAFSSEDEELVRIFGTHAAVALQAAADHDLAENLQKALHNSRRIGAAVGIIMWSERLSETEAFGALRAASQNTNRKLADVAEEVLDTGTLPQRDEPVEARQRRGSPLHEVAGNG